MGDSFSALRDDYDKTHELLAAEREENRRLSDALADARNNLATACEHIDRLCEEVDDLRGKLGRARGELIDAALGFEQLGFPTPAEQARNVSDTTAAPDDPTITPRVFLTERVNKDG